jgi:hypothetical protein
LRARDTPENVPEHAHMPDDPDSVTPSLSFWLQILIGALGGVVVVSAFAGLGILGVPLGLPVWGVTFLLLWLGAFFCMKRQLRGIIVGFGTAAFLAYVTYLALVKHQDSMT